MALADTARLIASLDLKGNFNAQIRASQNALGGFENRLDRTQSRAYRAGAQIGTGIKRGAAIAATALIGLGVTGATIFTKAIGSASDLNETISKVGVVFKAQQGPVLALGKTAAASLGLSQNAALGAAATYGNLFVSMGLAQKQSATMSVALVKLAADLASFNNVDPSEALDALRSGLTGETEPLKRFGININEQILKNKALELGLVKLSRGQKNYTAVLPAAIKAQAAYALILEQSKTAQGDFSRTSDGLANQTRILKANWEDLKAALAGPSLPGVAKIMKAINREVVANQPAIKQLADNIAGLFSDENIEKGIALFKGGISAAKDAAPIIADSAKTTLSLVQAAVSVFKSLPEPIQKLAVGALAVNKLTGGLVTNIAGGIIETVGKNFFQRGATPANPLFVADVTGGLKGIAGAAGAAGGVGIRAAIMSQISTALIGLKALALPLLTTVAIPAVVGLIAAGKLAGIGPFAKNETFQRGGTLTQPRATGTRADERLEAIYGATKDQTRAAEMNARRIEAAENRTGSLINSAGKVIAAQIHPLHLALKAQLGALKTATKNLDLQRLGKGIANLISGKNVGNLAQTREALKELRSALGRTHDAKTASILRAAIARVTAKLPAREFAAKAHAQAERILRSSESTSRKIADLKEIERSLKDRKLPDAANSIHRKIVAAQREAKAAQVKATANVAAAVRKKKLDVTTNVTVPVTSYVSVQGILKKQQITSRYSQNRAQ